MLNSKLKQLSDAITKIENNTAKKVIETLENLRHSINLEKQVNDSSHSNLLKIFGEIEEVLKPISIENENYNKKNVKSAQLDLDKELEKVQKLDFSCVEVDLTDLKAYLNSNSPLLPQFHELFQNCKDIQKKIKEKHSKDIQELDDWDLPSSRNVNPNVLRQIRSETKIFKKIKKRELPETLTIKVDILNVVDLDEFYVRNRNHNSKENDEEFIKCLQKFYNKSKNLKQLKNPQKDYVGVINIDNIWFRCRIHKIAENSDFCSIYLVDEGRHETVNVREIKKLANEHFEYNEIAQKCSLANLSPINSNGYPKKAKEKFKIFAFNSQYKSKIYLVETLPEYSQNAIPCLLYFCGFNNCKKFFINAFMVEQNYAISKNSKILGDVLQNDSEAEDELYAIKQKQLQMKQNEELNNEKFVDDEMLEPTIRVPVKVLKVVSPNEFYIAAESREKEIQNLHSKIQMYVRNSEQVDWYVGDKCLVFSSINDKSKQWYRAIILETLENQDFLVMLIDFGEKVTINITNLLAISDEFALNPPAAIKAHLFGAQPNGDTKNWSQSVIETFANLVNSFKKFSVSVFEKNDDKSLPVMLYGVEEESEFLKGPQLLYYNIALYMHSKGLIDSVLSNNGENFILTERFAHPSTLEIVYEKMTAQGIVNQLNIKSTEYNRVIHVNDEEFNVNFTPKVIKNWIPAETLQVGQSFFGVPTYTDKDGTIYISSLNQRQILSQLSDLLTEAYRDFNFYDYDCFAFPQPGDCVIAIWKDKKYYRGQIIRRSQSLERDYQVRFVDYGTIETVNMSYIHLKVVAENIPIQTNRYVLVDIIPNNGKKWNELELNAIHSSAVDYDSLVQIVKLTPYDDIRGIKLRVIESNHLIDDLSETMVQKGFARYPKSHEKWPIKFKNVDDEQIKETNALKIITEDFDKSPKNLEAKSTEVVENTSDVNVRKMQLRFDKKKVSFFITQNSQSIEESEDDKISTPLKIKKKNKLKAGYKTNRAPMIDLRELDYDEFECIWLGTFDVNSLTFTVKPILKEIEEKYNATMEKINKLPENYLRSFSSNIEKAIGRSCLFPKSNKWLRGEIVEVLENGLVKVNLIDEGVAEIIFFRDLRKTDVNVLKCPRKLLNVKLYQAITKMQRNPRILIDKIDEKYFQKKVQVTVKGYTAEDVPIIEINE